MTDRPTEAVFELLVRNHPGVMSHITALFTRRAYNLERIICGPVGTGVHSRVILVVRDPLRLRQLARDLAQLYDVIEVARCDDRGDEWFAQFDALIGTGARTQP